MYHIEILNSLQKQPTGTNRKWNDRNYGNHGHNRKIEVSVHYNNYDLTHWTLKSKKWFVSTMNSLCIIKSFQPIDLKLFIITVMQQELKHAKFCEVYRLPQNPILSATISQYQRTIVTATRSSKPWDCSVKNYNFITSMFEARQGKWHFVSIIFNVERVSYLRTFCMDFYQR